MKTIKTFGDGGRWVEVMGVRVTVNKAGEVYAISDWSRADELVAAGHLKRNVWRGHGADGHDTFTLVEPAVKVQKAVFGDLDEKKVARFRAQQVKSITKMRAKGHRDFKDYTDEQIAAAAEQMVRFWVGSASGKMMFRKVTWQDV